MYKKLAKYYDVLGWGEFHEISWKFLRPLLMRENPASYLDLASGTGKLAASVARLDIDVVGIDNSKEMLEMAKVRFAITDLEKIPQFFHRDITRFNLHRKFDAVGCFFDAVNHVTTEKGFLKLFSNAARHLESGGFFIFDVNTTLGMHNWDPVLFTHKDQYAFVMKGEYDRSTRLAKITLKGHIVLEDGSKDHFHEIFYERAYPHRLILKTLRANGFEKITSIPDSKDKTLRSAHRVFYTAFKK